MPKKKNILVHTCCAPCLCFTHKKLKEDGWDITLFWFNPNIHPFEEYRRRLDTLRQYAARTGLPCLYRETYDLKNWLCFTEKGWKSEKKLRCGLCYELRLRETGRMAREKGFDGFTTTLLYSRYQFHEDIRSLAEKIGEEQGVEFIYSDLRTGWQEGIRISKEMGLYRQRYCGCIFSETEKG
ncbi:MAG: epoxyqueuosine reductase QueH [bacterium]|nr:epoxyqueuosine reductase QueH [bacterium]